MLFSGCCSVSEVVLGEVITRSFMAPGAVAP